MENLSKKEIVTQIGVIVNNHEIVKDEILKLTEVMLQLEKEYLALSEELNKRI